MQLGGGEKGSKLKFQDFGPFPMVKAFEWMCEFYPFSELLWVPLFVVISAPLTSSLTQKFKLKGVDERG